jgi:uncharacterized protein YqfB (UPF0267 family)
MKVIQATLKQKKELEGTYKNGSILEFILDADGKYVCNIAVIEDLDFIEIKDKLIALPQIDYKPIIEEDAL